MVFKAEKFRQVLEELMNKDNPQEAITQWVMHSPKTGEPLKFTTYVPRKSHLKVFLKKEYDFDYHTSLEEIKEMKRINNERFMDKPAKKYNITIIEEFLESMESKVNDEFTQDEIDLYETMDKRNLQRKGISHRVSNIVLYLMITSGRRISEVLKNYIGLNSDKTKLIFKLNKKGGSRESLVQPLIDVLEWDRIFQIIKRIIEKDTIETMTSRLNLFVKSTFGREFTTHDLRKIYASLCAKKDKRKIRKNAKISQCLNHDSINSAEHYNHTLVRKIVCDVCKGTPIHKKNISRHFKSKKHLKNLEKN